jgi:phage baseplate assembly protein W
MSRNSRFYRYPLGMNRLMQPAEAMAHPTGDLVTSVRQFLRLLLHTRPGQLRSAPDFGCTVWDLEFAHAVNRLQWEENLADSLVATVQRHETRLHAPSVEVELAVPSAKVSGAQPLARWGARIRISGTLGFTKEPFEYTTMLYIGQLAV